ncbi:MAG: hypothetical protein HYZ32_02945 [Hydrocarboniphaga effusa]|nr:hypothetical protein [Hydrocarboniphaga effusa]
MCGLSLLFVLAVAGPAPAQAAEDEIELEPIIVTPKINPLDESTERLRKMLEDSSCVGCGPLIEASRESIYKKAYYGVGAVLSFLSGMPEEPPNPTLEERLEGRVAGDWRMYERDPDR